jgi:SAM-dependent methyltransferase
VTTFQDQVEQWSSPPLDDLGYIPSSQLLALPDAEFSNAIEDAVVNRYTGWRNWEGRWRRVLGLDTTTDKKVLDYGSGIGIEGLQYARMDNDVYLADISADNLKVANRTFEVNGFTPLGLLLVEEDPPFFNFPHKVDIVHCAGVLHHIPHPEPVVARMSEKLKLKGELRLMLYSDRAWEVATQTEAPEIVYGHHKLEQYTRFWDGVGHFSDWYNADRLEKRFGEWFSLIVYEDLTAGGEYVAAVMQRK